MTSPENLPGFVVRAEAQRAAFDNGFRTERGVENGWLRSASSTANGEILDRRRVPLRGDHIERAENHAKRTE